MSGQVKIDHLDEDEPITGQNFALVSFVSPEGVKNTSLRALKIRGVFPDIDSAQKKAEELNTKDKYFHIFVMEVGKWAGWDPELNESNADKQRYHEKELNELVKNAKVKRDSERESANQRKKALIAGASRTDAMKQGKPVDPRTEAMRERLRKELEKRARKAKLEKLADNAISSTTTDETTKQTSTQTTTVVNESVADATTTSSEQVNELSKVVEEKKNELSTTDEQLERVKELIKQRQQTG